MIKLNNKGFAVSTILYGILALTILILMLIFGIMRASKDMNEDLVESIEERVNKCALQETDWENCYYNDGSCNDKHKMFDDCYSGGAIWLSDKIFEDNSIRSEDDIDFSQISSDTNGKGLYQTTTEQGTVYYFRGDVENNYVQFGKYQKNDYEYYVSPLGGFPYGESTYEACLANASNYGGTDCEKFGGSQGEDMYWRIVRINEDGTIKLVYAGTDINTMTGKLVDQNNSVAFKTAVNYINSPQKTKLDTWYVNQLEGLYGEYIADDKFCNNIDIVRTNGNNIYYKGYDRVTTYEPTYNCSANNSLSVANGKLKKPIGILTADEVMYAGGVLNKQNTTYYLKYVDSVTMTPSAEYASFVGQPDIYRIDKGTLTTIKDNGDSDFVEIYPVINLKADVGITGGNGTSNNPYVIKLY